MSNSVETTEAVETGSEVGEPLSMLGSELVKFNFVGSPQSSRHQTVELRRVPPGASSATIALAGFDLAYTDENQFGFGRCRVSLTTDKVVATCWATLRDDRTDQRRWEGTVEGLVTYFGQV
jgi:hypothetical protein